MFHVASTVLNPSSLIYSKILTGLMFLGALMNLISYLLPWLCWKFRTHIFNLAVLLWPLQRLGWNFSAYISHWRSHSESYYSWLSWRLFGTLFLFLSSYPIEYLVTNVFLFLSQNSISGTDFLFGYHWLCRLLKFFVCLSLTFSGYDH